MAKITQISACQILDSRGNPTIEATVVLDNGLSAISSCPSGASLGKYEAVELRDNNPNIYNGKGVLNAIKNIKDLIAPKIIGMDPENQELIDKTMTDLDGTKNKAKLGANAILSVSMAVCKAGAKAKLLPLYQHIKTLSKNQNNLNIPTPLFNILNGGMHAGKNVDFQEFIIIPNSKNNFSQKLEMGVKVYMSLKKILTEKNLQTLVGDEGGFAPILQNNTQALDLIVNAITNCGYALADSIFLGLDAASNTFYKDGKYYLKDYPSGMTPLEIINYYENLFVKYKFLYLEDLLSEDDWNSWQILTSKLSQNTIIVGDDLLVTNLERLKEAIDKKAANGILIKLNQIGTVTETINVVNLAKQSGIKTIVSHRSGETTDDFVADFAVGISSDYVKFGAPARGERVAKYNRLLKIENELSNS